MLILGIETSCDETAAALVRDGREVVSNVVYTQIPLHVPYGGVVPEVASRAHVDKIREVVGSAMTEKPDAVAVTYGPGLSPALIVGLNAAKGLARSLKVPLFAVNHIEAHLHTPFLDSELDVDEAMPALGLAVSGGHTTWVDMPRYGEYRIIGQTLDDAAGEAFDKAAKLLGLGYPGGPKIDKIAREWIAAGNLEKPGALIPFPKGRPREGVSALSGLGANLCVSFSGLKTSLLRYVQQAGGAEKIAADGEIPRVVASYQEAIVGALVERTENALATGSYRSIILGGGVSLNSRIREAFQTLAEKRAVRLLTAQPKYCGDNAAMIAALAYHKRDITGARAMEMDVCPSLEVGA
jgi:N6-L-threonylcarbamoyladenine synthase